MIYVECKPDAILVQAVAKLPRREVIHEIAGKSGVVKRLSGGRSIRGLVDEDPLATPPRYLATMQKREDLPERGLKLLHDAAKDNYLAILCPDLEGWVTRAARDAALDLGKYGLPPDPHRLRQIINVDLSKFERLAEGLKGSDRFESLRRLLEETTRTSRP